MARSTLAIARIRRFLEQEPIVWLSTVRPDGTPHIVPVWFWWDGEALLVFSKPDAIKVRNLRANDRVMLGVGDPDEDFDIGLFEGEAQLLDRPTHELVPEGLFRKYATQMAGIGLTREDYVATYAQAIRIVPVHYLGWHGRTIPTSARVAGAPSASFLEPRHAAVGTNGEPIAQPLAVPPAPSSLPELPGGRRGLLEWLGEPLSRGLRGLGVGLPRPSGAGAL